VPLNITDFRMAGFLVARGIPLTALERNAKGEVVFVFMGAKAHEVYYQYPGSAEAQYDAACKTMHAYIRNFGG
jgi:hypothetical protein